MGLMPVDGSPPVKSFNIASFPIMLRWTPRGDAVTFLESRQGAQSLWNQPLEGGPPQQLVDLGGHRIFNFAWSSDGRLAVAHGPVPTDVVLLTGVR